MPIFVYLMIGRPEIMFFCIVYLHHKVQAKTRVNNISALLYLLKQRTHQSSCVVEGLLVLA